MRYHRRPSRRGAGPALPDLLDRKDPGRRRVELNQGGGARGSGSIGQRYEQRHRDRRDDDSDAIIAGIIGFALGAAIAASQTEHETASERLDDPDWIAYCARKYRSFDPRSGTYLAYDGLRRYCR